MYLDLEDLKEENSRLKAELAARKDPWEEKGSAVYFFENDQTGRTITQIMSAENYNSLLHELKSQEASSNIYYGRGDDNLYTQVMAVLRDADANRIKAIY